MQVPPLKAPNGEWVRKNNQKADLFASYLEETFHPHDTENDSNFHDIIYHEESEIISPVTPKEVETEIKNINGKKAPGYELITGELLKKLPHKAIVKLTNIINASFRLKYVPSAWKVSEVIMIMKPGKSPNEIASYRPISLLPVMSKVYEKLLIKRLKPIIDKKQLVPGHQFGFRTKHSTIEQVHRLVNIIENTLEEGKVCSAAFLDVAQAFDRVWHQGLVYKLSKSLPKSYVGS